MCKYLCGEIEYFVNIPRVVQLSHKVVLFLGFEKPPDRFPKLLKLFILLPTVYKESPLHINMTTNIDYHLYS